jgi:hypothetical protein
MNGWLILREYKELVIASVIERKMVRMMTDMNIGPIFQNLIRIKQYAVPPFRKED